MVKGLFRITELVLCETLSPILSVTQEKLGIDTIVLHKSTDSRG